MSLFEFLCCTIDFIFWIATFSVICYIRADYKKLQQDIATLKNQRSDINDFD